MYPDLRRVAGNQIADSHWQVAAAELSPVQGVLQPIIAHCAGRTIIGEHRHSGPRHPRHFQTFILKQEYLGALVRHNAMPAMLPDVLQYFQVRQAMVKALPAQAAQQQKAAKAHAKALQHRNGGGVSRKLKSCPAEYLALPEPVQRQKRSGDLTGLSG